MKKLGVCFALFFFIAGAVCFAQSNNDAQLIVGTWTSPKGNSTFVFNANGTCSWNGSNRRYFVSNGKILLDNFEAWDYYLSSDGKALFIMGRSEYDRVWLDKK